MKEKNGKDIIFLCGFMGTGKTTVGRALANMLHVSFRDLDDVIEERTGRSIPAIFKQDGEAVFREEERAALQAMAESYSGVLALGGGSLHNLELTEYLKGKGLLIFIETPISVILKRISRNPNRPLLLDEEGNIKDFNILKKQLADLYNQRLPLYKQADITISGSSFPSVDTFVNELIQKINDYVSKP